MQYIEQCVQLRMYRRHLEKQRQHGTRDADKFCLLYLKSGLTTPQLILMGGIYSIYSLKTSLVDSSKKWPTTPVMEKILNLH